MLFRLINLNYKISIYSKIINKIEKDLKKAISECYEKGGVSKESKGKLEEHAREFIRERKKKLIWMLVRKILKTFLKIFLLKIK